jgi:hypothetical protein
MKGSLTKDFSLFLPEKLWYATNIHGVIPWQCSYALVGSLSVGLKSKMCFLLLTIKCIFELEVKRFVPEMGAEVN